MDVGFQSFGGGPLVRGGAFGVDPALRRAGMALASAPDVLGSACCVVLSIDRIGMIAAA